MLSQVRGSDEKATKRRRIRACDQCRRRKVRCDGGDLPPGQRCNNCVAFGYECTYVAASDKRFADIDYVKSLEREVLELRARLSALEPSSTSSPLVENDNTPSSTQTAAVLQRPVQPTPVATQVIEEDIESAEAVVELFHNMKLDTKHTHYLGRSSSLAFVRTAMALKQEYIQDDEPESQESTPKAELHARRPESWDATTSLIRLEPPYPPEVFPDADLITELVEVFFSHINIFFPLLHRPTFENCLEDGLHLREEGFGSTLLLVCAVASRFSNDDRTLPPETTSWHWAGWPWFRHVCAARKLVHLSSPSVYDLQVCVLITWYIASSPVPHALYTMVGHGIRLAQDMGVHRRATYGSRLTVEDELKKRAFWCLIGMERGMCDKLGRPYNIHDEDFDVDLPVECDDEYWINDDTALAFKQPPGKPSTVSMFIQVLRLGRILAHAYRTIYCMPMDKSLANPDDAQRVVSELDSELNKFISSVPVHLKWDSQQDNFVFLNQSAFLYTSYYTLQITVHRSFVPLPRRPSPLSFPSLAICTNAARSCIRVLESQYTKLGSSLFLHWHQMSLFTCSVILLLNVWHGKMAGITINPTRELGEVQKAMRILQELESRWSTAARLWEILNDIVEVMNRPLTASGPNVARPHKRRRDDESDPLRDKATMETSPFPPSDLQTPFRWKFSSTDGKAAAQTPDGAVPTSHLPSTFPQSVFDFTLPLHSDELGRLPIWTDESVSPQPMASSSDEVWSPFAPETSVDYGSTRHVPMFPAQPGLDQQQPQIDPELEAIFADLIPDGSYGYPFAMLPQTSSAHATHPPIFAQGSGMSSVSSNQQSMFTNQTAAPMLPQGSSAILSNGGSMLWDEPSMTS